MTLGKYLRHQNVNSATMNVTPNWAALGIDLSSVYGKVIDLRLDTNRVDWGWGSNEARYVQILDPFTAVRAIGGSGANRVVYWAASTTGINAPGSVPIIPADLDRICLRWVTRYQPSSAAGDRTITEWYWGLDFEDWIPIGTDSRWLNLGTTNLASAIYFMHWGSVSGFSGGPGEFGGRVYKAEGFVNDQVMYRYDMSDLPDAPTDGVGAAPGAGSFTKNWADETGALWSVVNEELWGFGEVDPPSPWSVGSILIAAPPAQAPDTAVANLNWWATAIGGGNYRVEVWIAMVYDPDHEPDSIRVDVEVSIGGSSFGFWGNGVGNDPIWERSPGRMKVRFDFTIGWPVGWPTYRGPYVAAVWEEANQSDLLYIANNNGSNQPPPPASLAPGQIYTYEPQNIAKMPDYPTPIP